MSGRILILDAIATNRIVLRCKLSAACYEVAQASDADQALALADRILPDLILVNADGGADAALSFCQAMVTGRALHAPPVVILASAPDLGLRLAALRAGAAEVLSKPLPDDLLLAHLRRLLRQRTIAAELEARDMTRRQLGLAEGGPDFAHRGVVALVPPDARTGLAWRTGIEPLLAEEVVLKQRDDVLARRDDTGGSVPDIFVIAAHLAGNRDGLRLLSELRSRQETRHSAMIVVFDPSQDEADLADLAAMALDLGADDLLTTGFQADELSVRITAQLAHKQRSDALRRSVRAGLEMAVRDPLTGLYNRRYAVPHLQSMSTRAEHQGQSFAVMLLDLDRFKTVNDTYGHATGDAVLIEVAQRLRANVRGEDLVARLGGEEFLVAMPDTELDEAEIAARRLCALIRDEPIVLPQAGLALHVTLSIGVALGGAGLSAPVEALLEQADAALYGSKADGRDQITVCRSAA